MINKGDVARDHELAVAVMNLIGVEEHLAFTVSKTSRKEYLEIYNEVRKLRSKLMKRIVRNRDGEMWCVSKHLLSSTMRLMETAIKYASENKQDEAIKLLIDAADTFQLFWFIQKIGEKDEHDKKTGKKTQRSKRRN
ncbi:hypothetical protein GOV08_05270 [Candidatus Woesearchaeota archaeon]|nr:hypothetical protein [Candidatus Woesearchaeota archaeon]